MNNTGTGILRQEHEAILKMLRVSGEVARHLAHEDGVQPEILEDLTEFFRLFADRCHHGKEEEALFPLLHAKGIPVQGGPIGVMLGEHDLGRAYVREMAEAAREYRTHCEAAGARWAKASLAYGELLRNHILKENNILFSMAEQMLSPEEQTRLAEAFDRIEIEKMGAGVHERLHRKIELLSSEFVGS